MTASPPLAPKASLLIVDDDVTQLKALCDTLESQRYATSGFTRAADALDSLRDSTFDLLLTDLQMPAMNGIELLRRAQAIDGDLAAVVMTGHGTLDTAVEALKAGALDYIQKPFKLSVMLPVIERALTMRHLKREKARLEQRVHERTTALKQANRELEAFTYSVSHDLRAPLRLVTGYAQMLMDDHLGELSQDAQRLLRNVSDGARRMDALVGDLLRLSQLGRQGLTRGSVRPADLAREVWASLAELRGERRIEFIAADLPACFADIALLRQVFANLLSNAIKFTRERAAARVEVGGSVDGGTLTCFVNDNGAGFDMRYAERLFGVFQRLHGADRFEGTGVGLSIVKRIIERHGGRVWAEATPDRGATFYFTLPDIAARPE